MHCKSIKGTVTWSIIVPLRARADHQGTLSESRTVTCSAKHQPRSSTPRRDLDHLTTNFTFTNIPELLDVRVHMTVLKLAF